MERGSKPRASKEDTLHRDSRFSHPVTDTPKISGSSLVTEQDLKYNFPIISTLLFSQKDPLFPYKEPFLGENI